MNASPKKDPVKKSIPTSKKNTSSNNSPLPATAEIPQPLLVDPKALEDEDYDEDEEEIDENQDIEDPTAELEENLEPISDSRLDIHFRVLRELQKQSIFFIDIETSKYIDGLIYLPSIGLSFTPPPPKVTQSGMGFLNLSNKKSPDQNIDKLGLDALLFFHYSGPECLTGYLKKEEAYLFFLKVWNDLEYTRWKEILQKVIDVVSVERNGVSYPLVKFIVSTTFIPNSPDEPNKLIIALPQKAMETVQAISSQRIHSPRGNDDRLSFRF